MITPFRTSPHTPSAFADNRRSLRAVVAVTVLALLAILVPAGPADAQGASSFVFQGRGWGHGVGMSQNGARNMANQGIDHVGILTRYYPNTVVGTTPTLESIRVHIGDASKVTMTSEGPITFERADVGLNGTAAGSISISAHDGGLQIGQVWTPASVAQPVMVSFPQPVKLENNGHRYLWGRFQLTNRDGKVRVVEVLPLEDYVAGISEMPAAWPQEALMAQAIAARTYAHEVTLHRRGSSEWAQEYDISGTTVDQNYIGWDAQDGAFDLRWTAAVTATANVEIVDSNGPVRAYYSASNGGWTETAAYVFSNPVAYTVSGEDPFDEGGHPWTTWERTYSQASMSRWLSANPATNVGTVQSITVLGGAGASARLDKATVEIVGSGATRRVTGKALMLAINAGVFGEGGGLAEHLPGTFMTIGNGAGVGLPNPSGVADNSTVVPDATPTPEGTPSTDDGGFTPPPGWTPEPGTGVPPGQPVAPGDAAPGDNGAGDAGDNGGFTPPPGWTPEPGTGVPPGQPVAPGDAAPGDAAPGDDGAGNAGDDGGFTPPPDWTPEPGTGVPPGQPVAPIGSEDPDDPTSSTGEAVDNTNETGGTDAADDTNDSGGYTPPPGWTPEPGTGVAPLSAQTASVAEPSAASVAAASTSVILVTRDESGEDDDFEVVVQSEDLAEEARARLRGLQREAALGLFADRDLEGYINSLADEPVHGVCAASEDGVVCIAIEVYRELLAEN